MTQQQAQLLTRLHKAIDALGLRYSDTSDAELLVNQLSNGASGLETFELLEEVAGDLEAIINEIKK